MRPTDRDAERSRDTRDTSLFLQIAEDFTDAQSIWFNTKRRPLSCMKDITPIIKLIGGLIVIYIVLKVVEDFFHITSIIQSLISSIPYINDIILLLIAGAIMIAIEKKL
jgi:hypothetical protein